MRFRPSVACAALALGALLPAAASAQSSDAFVLPFGTFRLGVEGVHESYDTHFDASGTRIDLGEELGGELTPDRFPWVQPLADDLANFLTATQESPAASPEPPDAAATSLGLLDVGASASRTTAGARLAVGLLPRIEIGASLPIRRGDRLVHRFDLSGGNLGLNPDPTANGELLAGIGWEELGSADLLPTAESPMGVELQNRVTELTGEPMSLPADTVDAAFLEALLAGQYGFAPIASRIQPWRVGDLEIDARALLISTFGSAPLPVDRSPLDLRIALLAGARLPTGEVADTLDLLMPEPAEGISSISGGGAMDLFLGPRIWLSGTLRLTRGRSSEITRRIISPDSPLDSPEPPTAVTITPGDVTELRLAPRFRLGRAISFGGEYVLYDVGDTRYEGGTEELPAELLNLAGGRLQRIGVEMRYSSMPAYWLRAASLPAEVILAYHRTLSGPEGTLGGGIFTVTASVLPRVW